MSGCHGVNSRRTAEEIKSRVWGQDENSAVNLLVFIFVRLTLLCIPKKEGSSVIIILIVKKEIKKPKIYVCILSFPS